MLKGLLGYPGVRTQDLDDPRTTDRRVALIQRKGFLRRLYCEWYRALAKSARDVPEGPRVELGAGAGFIRDVIPGVIRSDVARMGNIDLVCRAENLPFPTASLSALYLVDVLHHVPEPARFFDECVRCLRPGGGVFMIEPAATPWARFVWKTFHHEPFIAGAGWSLPGGGPLSDANSALPWILFVRDRAAFERRFPELRIDMLRPFMPFAYLLSGGVSMRSLLPGACYRPWRMAETALGPLNRALGMFMVIALHRRSDGANEMRKRVNE